MNEQQIVALGQYCETLMRDDTFNFLCELYGQNAFKAMMATAPHEVKKREGVYAEVWGLQNFLAMMVGFVEQRKRIIAEDNSDQETDEEDTE